MRSRFVALLVLVLVVRGSAGQEDRRHGIARDVKTYPQATAKETLASVVEAIRAMKVDYLVAHLADPAFVDDRVKRIYAGKFEEQVRDTRARLDPATVKQLGRFLKEGKWTIDKEAATVQLEDVKDRCVRLKQKGGVWYLEHRFDLPEK